MEDENDESWLYGNADTQDQPDQPAGEEETENQNFLKDGENQEAETYDEHQNKVEHENGDGTRNQTLDSSRDIDDSLQGAFHEDDTAEMGLEGEQPEGEKPEGEMEDDSDSDDDDDDINVVIGDIKSGPTYNIKVSYFTTSAKINFLIFFIFHSNEVKQWQHQMQLEQDNQLVNSTLKSLSQLG